MRFAAIADVHGNRLALEAVLEDAADLGVQRSPIGSSGLALKPD